MKTIQQAIAEHGATHIYREIDFEPGCADRMVALGLERPKTLRDVWGAHSVAFDALTPAERRGETRELRVRLDYLASASKTGIAPRMPRTRLTR